jgi:formylglycine-generating enzyme required for sulfatase activity
MRLTGRQFSHLHAGIVAAFTRDELRRVLKVELETDLELITGDKGFEAQVFDLLLWLERQGRMLEFVERARAANPGNEALAAADAAIYAGAAQGESDDDPSPTADLSTVLGIEWVTVAGGGSRLGSDLLHDHWAQDAEMPQHEVVLPAFQIARCPITNYQYQLFVQATEHAPPPHWRDGVFPTGKHDHPVVNVSWYDALDFCRWAAVRLPSEALWERAARGPDGRLWPWGDHSPTVMHCNFALQIADTTSVTLFPAGVSPYGVLDMAGNVWEWTSSLWRPYPYDPADGRENEQGSGLRVVRGGSYDSPSRQVRCACRSAINPSYGYDDVGMRVVLYNPPARIPIRK